jgi:hypothetical protein
MLKSPLYFLLLLLPFVSFSQMNDASLWLSFELEKKINKKTDFGFKTQSRLRENFSTYDYSFFDFGLSRKLAKGLAIDGAYVLNTRRKFVGERFVMIPRHQFYATVRYARDFGNWKIANRNRVQTQIEDEGFLESSETLDYFYRNKTIAKYQLNKKWAPYCSYEAYFRLNNKPLWENDIFRHRGSIGTKYNITKRRQLDFYYMYQHQLRRARPDNIHVIGIIYSRSYK